MRQYLIGLAADDGRGDGVAPASVLRWLRCPGGELLAAPTRAAATARLGLCDVAAPVQYYAARPQYY